MAQECKVCTALDMDEQEELGLLALRGELSWAEVARRLDLPNIKGIQNHMKRHYIPPPSDDDLLKEELEPLVQQSIDELTEQMSMVPPEVKPFYLAAIKNLRGLHETKPSQQHLLMALKNIHEVTGMKMEQQLMLEFARAKFGVGGKAAKAAIDKHADVIDVDEA